MNNYMPGGSGGGRRRERDGELQRAPAELLNGDEYPHLNQLWARLLIKRR